MSERKFRVWEVFASVSGNVTLVARFPYRERADADRLARELRGGYVLSADASRPLHCPERLATADRKPDIQSQVSPPAVVHPVDNLPLITTPRVNVWC